MKKLYHAEPTRRLIVSPNRDVHRRVISPQTRGTTTVSTIADKKRKYLETTATITLLEERWPKAFFLREVKRKPLKIGVDRDIVAALNGTLAPDQLRDALRSYVAAAGYLRALQPNATRVDLDGLPAGLVSAAAATVAREQLVHTLSKQEARRKARVAQEQPAVKPVAEPEPVIEKGPKRLGLSDLKAAWAARQKEVVQ